VVYAIDFGVATRLDAEEMQQNSEVIGLPVGGTARYARLKNHLPLSCAGLMKSTPKCIAILLYLPCKDLTSLF
jgi:hypothetical protein